MPWENLKVENLRLKLIQSFLKGEETMTDLCLENGISRKTGYKWLARYEKYGATVLMECNQLETWLFESPEPSETASTNAAHCIKCWRDYLEIKDAYYGDFEEFELPEPKEGEILQDYIMRMARLVEEEGKGSRLEWRALKSFLGYMRNLAHEEIAFIEQIFPFKMNIHDSRIIRLIEPEVYPISQAIAADILKELARMCKYGRPNAKHGAAEALGLCWLCLSASRMRLPITLTDIHGTKKTSVFADEKCAKLLVPTIFGNRSLRISRRLAKYLSALAGISSIDPRKTILQRPKRSLMRVLDRAIENLRLDPKLGNITFVTLISSPDISGGDHRYVRNS